VSATLTESITVAGLYDIPAEQYHRDPVEGGSLSSTGARRLLASPARFRYDQDHPSAPKKEYDLGHAAHQLVLGAGPELVRVDADEWRTKAIKEHVAAIRTAGAVPLRPADWDAVRAMAEQLRRHPLAGPLLSSGGVAEQTVVWRDERTGVMCRAMIDYRTGRIVADYKTTTDASNDALRRAIATYGYYIQAAHYLDGIAAVTGVEAGFLFMAQEKDPPYLVNVVQCDDEYLAIGRARIARAREIYRDCTESGIWPGYPTDDIPTLSPPRWLAYQHEETL
jgi:hypothetical protein